MTTPLHDFLLSASNFVWAMLIPLLLGTGIYLFFGLRFLPLRHFAAAGRFMVKGMAHGKQEGKGEITPFQALSVAISGQVGAGNIAGVATAIYLGGPGAVFWMWATAVVGMATAYCEAFLAVRFRRENQRGETVGGPMYYIRHGLGERWGFLASLFSFLAIVTALVTFNMVQGNSAAHLMESSFGWPAWFSGVVLAAMVLIVIMGGVSRLGRWAEALVPIMALLYCGTALLIVVIHITEIPAIMATILHDAFAPQSAGDSLFGGGIGLAIRYGVARGIFSNEAGLGSTPIAHAAARTNEPAQQGLVAMMGTFFDTIIVCSMTAFVILLTGALESGETGAALSSRAFDDGLRTFLPFLPGLGSLVVSLGLLLFVFTTILAWGYYGERNVEYLMGNRAVGPYRGLWGIMVFLGAIGNLEDLWLAADIMNGLMALPNLVALLLLSRLVFSETRNWERKGPY